MSITRCCPFFFCALMHGLRPLSLIGLYCSITLKPTFPISYYVRVREYIAEIQKELQLKEGQKSKLNITSEPKEEMKSVMDRLESRKLVDILSKGWEADENKELVKHLLANRLAYVEKFEMPSVRVEELDDGDESGDENYSHSKSSTIIERDSPFETLYEYMLDDISELYEEETSRMDARDGKEEGDNSFSGRIMAMMDAKYQLHAVEKELRGQQSFGKFIFIQFAVGRTIIDMLRKYLDF